MNSNASESNRNTVVIAEKLKKPLTKDTVIPSTHCVEGVSSVLNVEEFV